MEIRTLAQLTTLDDRTRNAMPPWMAARSEGAPEHRLERLQRQVADCDLVPAVPAHVRNFYEPCRALHTYGYFAYEFFTVVVQRVYFVLEAALGQRFLDRYPNGVPLEHGVAGKTAVLKAASYAHVPAALRRGGRYPHAGGNGWRLPDHPHFDGGMRALLDWAREERLLYGQRNRAVEDAIVTFRNEAAHPHSDLLVMPGESSRAIRTVAEIINHLWGHDMPHGRLYGPPPPMDLFAVWWGDGARGSWYADALADVPQEHRAGRWALIEAAEADYADLMDWRPDYETLDYATRLVWHGTAWEEAVTEAHAYRAAGRRPEPQEFRDRLFLLRHGDGAVEAPRSPEQFLRLAPAERDVPGKHWRVMRADHPGDAAHRLVAELRASFDPPPAFPRLRVDDSSDFDTWGQAQDELARRLPEVAGSLPPAG